MNDVFIVAIIQFTEGDYGKRLSKEAKEQIIVLGTYFIQFKMFTYL